MRYTDAELKQIEEFAGINYSPEQIAVVLQIDNEAFLFDFTNPDSPAFEAYQRGSLLANAAIRQNIVSSAKSSVTGAQEYKKMLEADKLAKLKQDISASPDSNKSTAALQMQYKDSIETYHKLTEFINNNPENLDFPPDLEVYWHRLNTAHDLQTKFANRAKGRKYMVKVLRRKYPDISESAAYRYLFESLNFFAVQLDRPQWRNILTDDLEKAKSLAWEMNRVDWFIKAVKEQAEIQQVKLPEPETIDPELLQEKVLLIVNDPGVLSEDLKKIAPEKLIDKIKEFDIEMEDKIRLAKDAGIEDVDYEEIFNVETDEEEIPE